MRVTIIGLTAVLLLAAVSARGETLRVPRDFETPAAAVRDARAGDTILVEGGPYGRMDIRGKTELTIRGKGRPRIGDVDITGSSDIRLEGLRIDGSGGASLYVYVSHRIVVRKCDFMDMTGSGILTDGGTEITIEKCRFERLGEHGIAIAGGPFRPTYGGVIRKNRLREIGRIGVGVFEGTSFLVERNVVTDSDGGFYAGVRTHEDLGRGSVHGASRDHVFRRNRAERCRNGYAFVSAPDNRIEKNRCEDAAEIAYLVSGDRLVPGDGSGNLLLGNKATAPGAGFVIAADGNVLEGNKVRSPVNAGFYIGALDHEKCEVRGNKVSHAGSSGFEVRGAGHALTANRATHSGTSGFYVAATGCAIAENRARKSGRYDLQDERGGNSYRENDFGSVSVRFGLGPDDD
jgi:nitrous oxidase accessory protein NosD